MMIVSFVQLLLLLDTLEPADTFDLGWRYFEAGKYSQVEAVYDAYKEMAAGKNKEYYQATMDYTLGHVELKRKDYSKAKLLFESAEEIFLKNKVTSGEMFDFIQLSLVRLDMNQKKNYINSAENLIEFLNKTKHYDMQKSHAYAMYLLSIAYSKMSQYDDALRWAEASACAYRQGSKSDYASALGQLGFCQMLNGDFEEGLNTTRLAIKVLGWSDPNDFYYILTNIVFYDRVYRKKPNLFNETVIRCRAKRDKDKELEGILDFVTNFKRESNNK